MELAIVDAEAIFDLFGSQPLKCGWKCGHGELGPPIPKAQGFGANPHPGVKINLLGA
jgi:hypothetical protein